MTTTVGADPEYALYDIRTKQVIPACGVVGGTKQNPIDLGDGHKVHEDNVSVELAFHPQRSAGAFSSATEEAQLRATKYIRNVSNRRLRLVPHNQFEFQEDQLQSVGARTFGCEPDFDAYAQGEERTRIPDFGNYRFFGGHIHIGGDFKCPPFVAALFADVYIGLLEKGWGLNPGPERQKWYGMPGIFRPKPYGIEYRTLSSMWTQDEGIRVGMGEGAINCANFLERSTPEHIKECLNRINWKTIRNTMLSGTERDCLLERDVAFMIMRGLR